MLLQISTRKLYKDCLLPMVSRANTVAFLAKALCWRFCKLDTPSFYWVMSVHQCLTSLIRQPNLCLHDTDNQIAPPHQKHNRNHGSENWQRYHISTRAHLLVTSNWSIYRTCTMSTSSGVDVGKFFGGSRRTITSPTTVWMVRNDSSKFLFSKIVPDSIVLAHPDKFEVNQVLLWDGCTS